MALSYNNKDTNLNVSIDDGAHSKYFAENKRVGKNEIIEFEIPKWLVDFMNEYKIPQDGYTKNPFNQSGTAPKIVDPTKPGVSYELPPPWVEWIEEYGRNARIIIP